MKQTTVLRLVLRNQNGELLAFKTHATHAMPNAWVVQSRIAKPPETLDLTLKSLMEDMRVRGSCAPFYANSVIQNSGKEYCVEIAYVCDVKSLEHANLPKDVEYAEWLTKEQLKKRMSIPGHKKCISALA